MSNDERPKRFARHRVLAEPAADHAQMHAIETETRQRRHAAENAAGKSAKADRDIVPDIKPEHHHVAIAAAPGAGFVRLVHLVHVADLFGRHEAVCPMRLEPDQHADRQRDTPKCDDRQQQ